MAFALLLAGQVHGAELFRESHQGYFYRFQSDAKDVPASVTKEAIIQRATDWVASFYRDEEMDFDEIEFRTRPIRHWLVTFKNYRSEEIFHVVLLPDQTIVEPVKEDQDLGRQE